MTDHLTRHEIQLIAEGKEMEAIAALIARKARPDVTRRRLARQLLELMDQQFNGRETER